VALTFVGVDARSGAAGALVAALSLAFHYPRVFFSRPPGLLRLAVCAPVANYRLRVRPLARVAALFGWLLAGRCAYGSSSN